MSGSERNTPTAPAQSQTVYWVIAVLLAVIATALWTRPGGKLLPSAFAQNQPRAGARGVFAFTGPLDRDKYGLFMLDVDQGTIWCYGFDTVNGVRKLRLLAGRSWIYDRYLQDFNCAEPNFREIQSLVSQQREQSLAPSRTTATHPPQRSPAVDGQPED
ncbi:MAG: hypothetical protein KAY37_10790 [Phycisphaerae bacterium]|nr:hypothetical protein [Phycisphaerae bacterium]